MGEYELKSVLVTGGAGFIGSTFLNYMVPKYPHTKFVNYDRLDYCSSLKNVTVSHHNNYGFVHGDVASYDLVRLVLDTHQITEVVHFSAQSSVNHSNNNAKQHVLDNVLALQQLLEACRHYGKIKRLICVSTDEAHGSQDDGIPAHEDSILMPNNVYSATKAAGEMIARAYRVSYKLPIIVTRGNNCYGPRQYPDKLFPSVITKLLRGQKIQIQGKGDSQRNFLHVDDTVRAFETILLKGQVGETYNIGTTNELSVLEVAELLRKKISPSIPFEEIVEYIAPRPFDDARYWITSDKLRALGWKEELDFDQGVTEMIEWYRTHLDGHWSS